MNSKLLILFSIPFVFVACNQSSDESSPEAMADTKNSAQYDRLLAEQRHLFEALPLKADNPENETTNDKIKLGHALYFDTRLSLTGNNSCNGCHNLDSYGVDNLPTSPGDAGGNGDRNSPTTLNAALHGSQFWDGRMKDVEEQAGGPVLNPVEMNMPSEQEVEKRLSNVDMYRVLFAKAYPEETNPVTYTNMRNAIGVFERQLLTPSRVDEYLLGDKSALSLQEKKGMLSFAYIGCTNCHSGSVLGGNQLQRFGVHKPYWEATASEHVDRGLFEQTNDSLDLYLFKVPSLRNISETHPYFHDGSVQDLEEAVRIMAEVQLDYKMNQKEVKNVVAFLEALTGEVPPKYKQNPLAIAE
ncbi:MAG TPA: cytochrome-c peroxidase [Flavobacteriales bacterium]|nr:c-type cytochrome [Flavobacteriales bacterium]HAW20304.1 cytochrome-c peroxidase [Flavobacteriales bacterium]